MATVTSSRKLLIKNLPPELEDEDKIDLLRHFEAVEVVAFGRRGSMRNCAYATFVDEAAAQKGLGRLHQLEVLGNKLVVEYAKPQHEKLANKEETKTVLNKVSNVKLQKKENIKQIKKDETKDDLPEGMAPKLGVKHGFPPHLTYFYPPPTVGILTNIANALASVPKFYTQVLHLMNKMNLPPPFSAPTPTPPLPGDSVTLVDVCVDTEDLHEFASGEESELESDTEESRYDKLFGVKSTIEPPRKKKRLKAAKIPKDTVALKRKQQQQQPVEEAFEQAQNITTKRIEFKLASNIASTFESAQRVGMSTAGYPSSGPGYSTVITLESAAPEVATSGFGTFNPTPVEEVESEQEEEEGSDNDDDYGGHYISMRELKRNRMVDEEILSLPQFKNYQRGERTTRLYIKNLAKQVQEEDLQYIFKRFVRDCPQEDQEKFDIRLMKEGRMKGQAFINFPTEVLAEKAVKAVHGYILHGKPMVIQFARSGKAKDS